MTIKTMCKPFRLGTGETHFIPADLELREPHESGLDASRRHYLIYIPWDDKYLANVDAEYQSFFRKVLPYLYARTTNVHITQCLPLVRELVRATAQPTDE